MRVIVKKIILYILKMKVIKHVFLIHAIKKIFINTKTIMKQMIINNVIQFVIMYGTMIMKTILYAK